MKKIGLVLLIFVIATIIFSGCSKDMFLPFQENTTAAPFNLYHLFDDYTALKYAWDSVPGSIGNHKMAEMMQSDIPGTTEFLSILSYLLLKADNPGLGLLDDMKAALNLMVDENQRFYSDNDLDSFYAKDDPSVMMGNFYGFLDELSRDVGGDAPKVHDSVIVMMNRVLPYLLDEKTEEETQEFIEKLYMPTFYPDINYGGTGVRAKEGSYSLPISGIDDKSISSIKVPFGYKVTLYSNNDYTGSSWVLDSNETDLNIKGCDNAASSLKIEKDPESLVDLAEIAAQPMVMGDYPMYVTEGTTPAQDTLITDYGAMSGGVDSGLGNMSQGMRDLMYGMITLFNGETVDRAFMYKQLDSLYYALNDPETINMLVWNMSNFFTAGGCHYGTAEDTSNSDVYTADLKLRYSTNSANLYSNAEFRETMRETLAAMSGLLMRDDRRSSNTWYDGTTSQDYPMASFFKNVKKLYINWDNAQIKESIYDLIRFDMYGRDRRNNYGAFATSMLEHLLYLGAVAGNFGYEWKANANEAWDDGTNYYPFQRYYGHGKHTGYLTLNDSLLSFPLQPDISTATPMTTYQVAFDELTNPNYPDSVPENSPYGRKMVYRGADHFDCTGLNNYQFTIDANYPVLRCLSGPCAGDYGVSDGGGPGATTKNAYAPYTANGIGTMDLASWSFAHVIRACWEGEGPYYSTQGAQQTGASSYTYYRPDGTVYAHVDKTDPSHPIYTYPVSSGYDKEDPRKPGQRWNRYKGSWNTDHYLIKTQYINGLDGDPVDPMNGPRDEAHYWEPRDLNGDGFADSEKIFQIMGTTTNGSNSIRLQAANIRPIQIKVGCKVAGNNFTGFADVTSTTSFGSYATITINTTANADGSDTLSVYQPIDSLTIKNAQLTSTSPIITGLTDTSSLRIGMTVIGTQIPANAHIVSIDSASQITIDRNASSTGLYTIYISSWPTGKTVAGSPIIMNLANIDPDIVLSLSKGMVVSGPGIPDNAHIVSIDSESQITIDRDVITGYPETNLFFSYDGSAARTYYEIIDEKSADRECASIEEAIFRNFQWVMNEKKMVLIVPLYLTLGNLTFQSCCESAAYEIIEGNGITGLSTARKYRDNGIWAKANKGGTGDVYSLRANTSTIPGDYRITVISAPISNMHIANKWVMFTPGNIDNKKIYTNTLDTGSATPGVVANNIYALSRIGFPRSPLYSTADDTGKLTNDYEHRLLGSRKVDNNDSGGTDAGFLTTNAVWVKRNSLLPMLIALLAPLREKSYYVGPTHNNNALAKFLEGTKFLLKPTIFFNCNNTFHDDYAGVDISGVAQNGWLPRIMGLRDFANEAWHAPSYEYPYQVSFARGLIPDNQIVGFKDITNSPGDTTAWYGGKAVQKYYRPEEIPNMLSFLIDSNTDRCRNYRMNVRADSLISRMVAYDNDPSTETPDRPPVDETPLEYKDPNMTAINAICAGLEQFTSGIKGQPARGTQIDNMLTSQLSPIGTPVKQLAVPQWRFEHRVRPDDPSKWVDINLDKMLNKIKGGDDGNDSTKGLNRFHDPSGYYGDEVDDPNFTDMADLVSDLCDLMNKFMLKDGYKGGIYSISENLFDILDVMAQHSVTPEQVKGLQYALGKMLAYYEGSEHTWLLQGEEGFSVLFDLLTTAIPVVDAEMGNYASMNGKTKGEVFRSLLTSMQNVAKENGMMEFILDTVTIGPYSSGDVLTELNQWMASDLVSGEYTQFYSTLSDMLEDMSDTVSTAPTEEALQRIYEYYGFQPN